MITPYAWPSTSSRIDLDLSRNEGSTWFLDSIDGLDDLVQLANRYPRLDKLRTAVAERHGVQDRQVLVTAGGDDALARCFLTNAGKSFVTTTPTFEMVRNYGEQTRSLRTDVAWWDGPFPCEEFANEAANCDFAVVVSPNNPTGQSITSLELSRIAERSPFLVLDAAYAEFADEDLTKPALELGNVVVIRTMSKAFGLAGLRVGYVLGTTELIQEISAFGSPYPVSGLSAQLAELALRSGPPGRDRFVDEVRSERSQFRDTAMSLGLQTLSSQGNFVLIDPVDPDWFARAANSLGVAVRSFPDREELAQAVRVSMPGRRDDFERLERALKTVVAPQCLLFDLDGVIVDVAASYDEAIVATAASYGVSVSPAQISAERAGGNSNDDWALTARICRRAGTEVKLADVTARFEALYQGTPERPGLKLQESLLVSTDLLKKWRTKFPLGIVTGRPRRDAEEALDRFGIGDIFDTVVTRDDAPMKPDPTPVRLALANLGVDCGWFVGDTVDDITAARLAEVLPIAVAHKGGHSDSNHLAAAATVLSSTAQLQEILDETHQ